MLNQTCSMTARAQAQATTRPAVVVAGRRRSVRSNASSSLNQGLGFKEMRDGIKEMAKETVLSPRFYTTDFDEMEKLCTSPGMNKEELVACLEEFRQDYNKKHFVRNQTFPPAAKAITGATRKIFIEFLERSCTAEFSGFLLYKELARRLKDSAPEIAEIFLLLSRDEARHAGFINKALSDFNLALDLGFMTKNRSYTFFKPKFIIYATFLSEKIGYWRYISIYRHLQANPDNQLYPLFEYFENWCQDENRHGDFLAAMLKAKPDLLKGTEAKLWSRFFCLSVYITMYLNDNQRSAFYEALGMNTREFNKHVIIETNNSTERVFPQVPNVQTPLFWERMDSLVAMNTQILKLERDLPDAVAKIAKIPLQISMIVTMAQIYLEKPIDCGSVDLEPQVVTMY